MSTRSKRSIAKVETTPPPATPSPKRKKSNATPPKIESDDLKPAAESPKQVTASPQLLKKMKQMDNNFQKTPFPDYERPSPHECQAVCDALATMHHLPTRPKTFNLESTGANCGLVPDVLDALIRTILSQNTSNTNSTAARKGIEAVFGKGPNYENVRKATREDLEEAIRSGGLAKVKSKVIKAILDQVYEKYGSLSLNHLHTASDEEAMRELVSFQGVGPKTASCVLLFCLGRESFAVDTHVFRITKALGWVPSKADRETTFQHLDVRIPGPLKYPLHSMLVRHGRECKNCAAQSSPSKAQKDACPLKPFLGKKQPAKVEMDAKVKQED